MEPAFYLSTWGRRRGIRLMRHLCRHVRIVITIIIGLARLSCPVSSWPDRPLCATGGLDGWMHIRIGCRGQTRAGQPHAPK